MGSHGALRLRPSTGSAPPSSQGTTSTQRGVLSARAGLAATSVGCLRYSNVLLPVQPRVDRAPLKPASFPHLKVRDRAPVRFPLLSLAPANMISLDTARRPAGAPVRSVTHRVEIEHPALEKTLLGDAASEPLWQTLFSPATRAKKGERAPLADPRRQTHHGRMHHSVVDSSLDWGAAGNIEVEDLTDSRHTLPPVQVEPPRRRWLWQAVEGVFLSRAFSGALALVMATLFVSTLDVPWNGWFARQIVKIQGPIDTVMAHLSRPIRERAAFFIVDDFTNGVDHWVNNASLEVDPAGWLTVQEGLALHGGTQSLESYRFDFDAKIQSKAVGWVVRAPDTRNYYAYKLNQTGSRKSPIYSLSRYSMIDGIRGAITQNIDVPAHLTRAGDFNRVSVRVVGDQMTTLINGWGVDFWRDAEIKRGGVGLLADKGESALIRKMTVSGNDDTWGMILYGTMESVRSVQSLFSGESSTPAAIMFHRPGASGPQILHLRGAE